MDRGGYLQKYKSNDAIFDDLDLATKMMKISTTILHARPLIPHLTTTNSINELTRMLTNNPICLKNSSRICGAVDA